MKVAKGLMVSCEYDLKIKGGEVLESSSKTGPVVYKHGSGKMLPALEKHLEGLSAGEEKSGTIAGDEIAPEDELPTLAVPRSHFPADAKVEVGAFFEAKDPHGHPLKLEIRSVDGDQVMARAVHPLAGKDLEFRVKILQVRDAPPPVPPRPAALAEDDLIDAPPEQGKDGSAGKPGG
jgi:FKBP-type peptidyl-prolyl cis-trans isomerase 2